MRSCYSFINHELLLFIFYLFTFHAYALIDFVLSSCLSRLFYRRRLIHAVFSEIIVLTWIVLFSKVFAVAFKSCLCFFFFYSLGWEITCIKCILGQNSHCRQRNSRIWLAEVLQCVGCVTLPKVMTLCLSWKGLGERLFFFSHFLCSLFGDLPVQFNKYGDIEIRGNSYMNVFKMTRKTFSGRNGIVTANDVSEPWLLHWI